MNRFNEWSLAAAAVLSLFGAHAAALPSEWQREQSFNVSGTGLTKISLPVTTLDSARPSLEDLRLYDDAGNEIPYLIERPVPVTKTIRDVKSFRVAMQLRATVVTIETGIAQPLDTVTLETPAANFLKPVRVEGSNDGRNWQTLVQGQPIFRLSAGASKLAVTFPSGVWAWLRLTADDQRSAPIPFTGVRVQATMTEPAPIESQSVSISERNENPGETRLALDLGAANLDIISVQFETAEPLFTRSVTLAVPQISESAVREQAIGRGTIYKVGVEGQVASENLSAPLNQQVRSRELVAFIQNGDSPPLQISAVRIERRPVYLVFLARNSGTFHLLSGNSHCAAPRYDLSGLQMDLKKIAIASVQVTPTSPNPNYREPETLAGIQSDGAALDVADWRYRRPIRLLRDGVQQIELDPAILSHSETGFGDLRLVRDGKQIPYVLEHTSITRALQPAVTVTTDEKDKSISRWILRLPQPNLPISRIQCVSSSALFERDISVYEELADDRGEKYRRSLGGASWIQKPGQARKDFVLMFSGAPEGDTLVLETHNGDNPPIELAKFQAFYPVTRLLFKASAKDEISLYYGSPQVTYPRYDLSLVADQLLSANKSPAAFGDEEQLRKSSWTEKQKPGTGGIVFWGILALVVVGLLFVIAKLLPKASSP